MKTKWKKPILTVVGISLVVNPITFHSITLNSNAESYYFVDKDTYDQQLNKANEALEKAIESKVEKDIKNLVDIVVSLPYSIDYKTEEKQNILEKVYDLINEDLNDKDLKAKYGIYLIERSIKQATESKLYTDYELASALVNSLPDGSVKTKYTKTLTNLRKKVIKESMEEYLNSISKDDNQVVQSPPLDFSQLDDSDFNDYVGKDTGEYLPGYPLPGNSNNNNNKYPPTASEPDYSIHTEYKTIGGKCYKVSTKKIEGKKPTVTRELATGYDASFCSVLVVNHPRDLQKPYNFNRVQPSPPATGDNIKTSEYYQSSSYFGYNSNGTLGTNASQGKHLTLQYTLDKTEKEPYFYETDMIVGEDGTITYQQQRDVLFQLAIRSGGKAVEDKDRFLVLLENKIIVVQNKGDKIPVTSFDQILKGFKAQVKAMETTVGK